MRVLLTENAENTYFEIINKYSERKAKLFSENTISILNMIAKNNHIGTKYKKTEYRKFLLSRQIYLFYRIEQDVLYVVLFWDNKRNPLNLDIELSS